MPRARIVVPVDLTPETVVVAPPPECGGPHVLAVGDEGDPQALLRALPDVDVLLGRASGENARTPSLFARPLSIRVLSPAGRAEARPPCVDPAHTGPTWLCP